METLIPSAVGLCFTRKMVYANQDGSTSLSEEECVYMGRSVNGNLLFCRVGEEKYPCWQVLPEDFPIQIYKGDVPPPHFDIVTYEPNGRFYNAATGRIHQEPARVR